MTLQPTDNGNLSTRQEKKDFCWPESVERDLSNGTDIFEKINAQNPVLPTWKNPPVERTRKTGLCASFFSTDITASENSHSKLFRTYSMSRVHWSPSGWIFQDLIYIWISPVWSSLILIFLRFQSQKGYVSKEFPSIKLKTRRKKHKRQEEKSTKDLQVISQRFFQVLFWRQTALQSKRFFWRSRRY